MVSSLHTWWCLVLPSLSLLGRCTDDEYLGGVCLVSGDLARFAIKRASAMDTTTVAITRDMLEALFGKLLEFDFRNGPLRKKYDGVSPSLNPHFSKSCMCQSLVMPVSLYVYG